VRCLGACPGASQGFGVVAKAANHAFAATKIQTTPALTGPDKLVHEAINTADAAETSNPDIVLENMNDSL